MLEWLLATFSMFQRKHKSAKVPLEPIATINGENKEAFATPPGIPERRWVEAAGGHKYPFLESSDRNTKTAL
ncbi:hypothetical protein L596_022951 [Steinernema carpocapsae]|uniref:Uncharacterized protein n=1 Tax=Steinernema carpocapsae TaxID=34508 RepID=A0A4U5MC41_STECR|nr:hypothetical protein L596_022951 [Steinernema carpocapsae]